MESLVRCIIAGPNRSGTTFLHQLLMGHPNVTGIQEEIVVDPLFTNGISNFTHGNEPEEDKKKGFLNLFDAISQIGLKDEKVCFIKIAFLHPLFCKYFISGYYKYLNNAKLIIIIRNDLLAQYASQIRMNKTKIVTTTKNKINPDISLKLKINRRKFSKYLYNMYFIRKLLQKLEGDIFYVNYEKDILDKDSNISNRIFNFLSIPNIEPTWQNLLKVSPHPSKYITNYENILIFYEKAKSKYESMNLDDFKLSFRENKYLRLKKNVKQIINIIKE